MLVAFDAGNSQVSVGVHHGHSWLARWRMATDPARTVDETSVLLEAFFRDASLEPQSCDKVVASSVVPELVPVIRAVSERLFEADCLLLGPGVRTGMRVRYRPPWSLGTDRLADAVAARAIVGSPAIAVDFGTATTFNVVDGGGDFVGGAIAPGLGTAAGALAQGGARLSRIGLREVGKVGNVGRNTVEAMLAGVLHGYAGLVTGLLERMERELAASAPVPIIATGGHADAILPYLRHAVRHEPLLTLEGLRHIAGVAA